MSAILVIAMILPISAAACLLFRCKPEESNVFAFLILICAGCLTAVFGLLKISGYLVWFLNIAAVIFILYRLILKKEKPGFEFYRGFILFILVACLYWWLCRGRAFADWDDFSHWGSSLKYMYCSNQLYTSPSSSDAFKSYPPAAAVLQYMILKAFPAFGFREDIALYANALFTASAVLLPLRALNAKQKTFAVIFAGIFLSVCPMLVFPPYFFRAGVDGMLGIITGMILLSEFLPARTATTPWIQISGCFVLSLLKSSGFGLALLTGIFIAAFNIKSAVSEKKARNIIFSIAPLAAAIAAKLIWALHLNIVGASERWRSNENILSGIWQLATKTAPNYRYGVLHSFAAAVFKTPVYGSIIKMPFVFLLLAAILLFIFAALVKKPLKSSSADFKIIPLGAASISITVIFVVSLLISYLFVFEKSEALALSSIYRYLDTCSLMLLYICLSVCFVAVFSNGAKMYPLAAVPLLLSIILFNPVYLVQNIINAPTDAAQTNHDRYLSRYAAERINSLGIESPRLYLITANDAGIAELKIGYELMPQKLPSQASILMVSAPQNEPWVREVSAEGWSRELAQNYDYVYIYCPEDQFVRDYVSLFEDDSQIVVDRMFKVIPQPDGTAKLRCIDETDNNQ